MSDIRKCDFLVIGTGISGLLFSLKAAKQGRVCLLTKKAMSDSATSKAQGGIAAVMSDEDSLEAHIEDTVRVGAGLCHRDVVENIIRQGPAVIKELVEMGVDFCENEDCDEFDLGMEGGHSHRRVLHVKDHTGADIEKALIAKVRKESNIEIYEHHMAVNLFTHNARVMGAYVLDIKTGMIDPMDLNVGRAEEYVPGVTA
ncbi:MAG: FAD-binding protein, partial [Candidatus Thorarchaeota archaeon]